MATEMSTIQHICEQISNTGNIRYKKMFGEYMIYINDKPIILVCDNIPYIKEIDEIKELMSNAEKGIPYKGAKEHYILDIDDRYLCLETINLLEKITPLPKSKKK